jgi:hypothetical protein
MKNFLKGILFISIGMPIINTASAIISQTAELVCTYIATKTLALQENLPDQEEETHNVMGFAMPATEVEDEEEYEEGE